MNRTPLYIFDLDGTLADLKHRRHHVERPSLKCYDCGGKNRKACPVCFDLDVGFKPNWDAFHAECVNDTPIRPVIQVLETLMTAGDCNDSNEIWVFSGRNDSVKAETIAWLAKHTALDEWHCNWSLKMRKANDRRMDEVIKEEWLHAMSPEDRARLVMVFDDRNRVVDMWRRNGIVCAQVAPGNF